MKKNKREEPRVYHISSMLRVLVGGRVPYLSPGEVWFDEFAWKTIGDIHAKERDEHHDAEQREADCKCSAYSEDRGGGYFELMVEPDPDCPEHGAGIRAEAEVDEALISRAAQVLDVWLRDEYNRDRNTPRIPVLRAIADTLTREK